MTSFTRLVLTFRLCCSKFKLLHSLVSSTGALRSRFSRIRVPGPFFLITLISPPIWFTCKHTKLELRCLFLIWNWPYYFVAAFRSFQNLYFLLLTKVRTMHKPSPVPPCLKIMKKFSFSWKSLASHIWDQTWLTASLLLHNLQKMFVEFWLDSLQSSCWGISLLKAFKDRVPFSWINSWKKIR